MPASSLGRRRPRPVADAPALDGERVAKAWLVELVAVAPLEQAARLPGPRFAEDAPRLCAAVGAALAGDGAFDDLEPGGTLAPLAAGAAQLAAAAAPLDAVAALEALRAVTWSALVEELDRPAPAQVAELADRLAAVVAVLVAASLEGPRPPGSRRSADRGPLAAVLRGPERPPAAPAEEESPATESWTPAADVMHAADAPPAADVMHAADAEPDPGPTAAKERAEEPEPEPAPRPSPPAAELRDLAATLRDAATSPDPLERLRELAAAARPAVEDATDFRAARIAPWTSAIDRRLARHRQDGLPFAVLCVELVDLGLLAGPGHDDEVAAAVEAAESAVCAQLRPADALVREQAGRYWLTAPDTDALLARALAHRVAAAVAEAPGLRGVPLQAAVGVAACPADGTEAAALEARAEEGLYAARAAGVRVGGPVGAG